MPVVLRPKRQSPVHYKLTRAGGVMTEVAGWLVADHFGDAAGEVKMVRTGAGLSDRSAVPKFEVKGREGRDFLGRRLGRADPQPGRVEETREGYACLLSRERGLIVFDAVNASPPAWLTGGEPAEGCVHVLERTDGYGGFLVCGPAARDVVRKLSPLDLRDREFPAGSCAAGPMASVQAIVVRRDRAALPAYEVYFSREYAEYLWDVIMEAGSEFGIRPFGLAASRLLEEAQSALPNSPASG